MFAHPSFIEEQAERIFLELTKEKDEFQEMSAVQLAGRLAYYASELNALHPFREGNGRTIREFLRQLTLSSNYRIDWNKAGIEESLEAFIESYNGSLNKLIELIHRCLQ